MTSDAENLVLIRPDRRKHRRAIFDLTGKAFGRPYWDWLDHCEHDYIDHSPYDWSASTIGLLDGQVVTHWGIWDISIRVGAAVLRAACVGAVSTHGRFRRRGLMARTAAAACRAARRAGYDISLLFGIRDFYHRFGYVRAWPERTYVVRTADLPPGGPPGGRSAVRTT